jgi:hypothetical protein
MSETESLLTDHIPNLASILSTVPPMDYCDVIAESDQ